MIRKYKQGDLDNFNGNEFCNIELCLELIPHLDCYSLIDGEVKAVGAFQNYWGNNWNVFILMSKDFKQIRELKRFFDDFILINNVKRLQTESINCDILNRWHKFLGFELEGLKKQMIYNKDYNCWGLCGN